MSYVTDWFKSRRSTDGSGCVEIKFDGDRVLIRDTKQVGNGPVIAVELDHWDSFLAAVAAPLPAIVRHPDGGATLRSDETGLTFTRTEWDAFLGGIQDGEFQNPSSKRETIFSTTSLPRYVRVGMQTGCASH